MFTLLSTIFLKNNSNAEVSSLPLGTKGTILEVLDEKGVYLAEFFSDFSESLGTFTVSDDEISDTQMDSFTQEAAKYKFQIMSKIRLNDYSLYPDVPDLAEGIIVGYDESEEQYIVDFYGKGHNHQLRKRVEESNIILLN